jgi:hypothetical protein
MVVAAVFGTFLFLVLIFGDWYQFTSLQSWASRYGFGIARRQDRLAKIPSDSISHQFNSQGLLQLPHGVARFFQDQELIVIRPYYQLFAMRFRTAWPLKGTIEVKQEGQELFMGLVKRMPWTSALITMLWLALVVVGTLVFVVMFGLDGGFQSIGGVLLGLGIVALGVLVLVFGLVLLSLAYRLEDYRLMQVYQELQKALDPSLRQEE